MLTSKSLPAPKPARASKALFTRKSWYLGLVVGFAMASPTTFAVEAPPPDARAVVIDQVSAFEKDDAATAWRLTAPEMRAKFGTAANFLGVVKSKYGLIRSHRSVEFGRSEPVGGQIGMVVTIVDRDNEVWSVLFLLSKQPDGGWKTSDCLLARAQETSI